MVEWLTDNFVAILMFVVAMAGIFRSTKSDAGEAAALMAEMRADIKYIRQTVERLEKNYDALLLRVTELERRVEHAVERAKAAHLRLDRAGIDKHHE